MFDSLTVRDVAAAANVAPTVVVKVAHSSFLSLCFRFPRSLSLVLRTCVLNPFPPFRAVVRFLLSHWCVCCVLRILHRIALPRRPFARWRSISPPSPAKRYALVCSLPLFAVVGLCIGPRPKVDPIRLHARFVLIDCRSASSCGRRSMRACGFPPTPPKRPTEPARCGRASEVPFPFQPSPMLLLAIPCALPADCS